MTNEPAWQQLHDAWSERRQPQPGDLEAALGRALGGGASGMEPGPAATCLLTGQWTVSAVLVSGTSRIGHMPKVVSAQAPTEPTVLVELARCLVVYGRGAVPK